MMKTCKEITELLSDGMERPLAWQERLSIRVHIFYCKSCFRFKHQVIFLRKAAEQFRPGSKK
ncbi:zf-HC2 domain-containing protein [Methylomonas sp. AM2-LC]|uniref:zf-HC2 domain-containing protein n=1 Tax=Methylomonas sp. AM2-LC TaxID=3153301 RepID=UPI003265ED0C